MPSNNAVSVLFCSALIPFLLFAVSGCESESSTGDWANGEKAGKWTYYYTDGQLEKSGTYTAGVPEGEWLYWHENGQRKEKGPYQDGKKHGTWIFWEKSGQPIERGEYRDGKPHGSWVRWHENGQRAEQAEYRYGEKFGPWTRWDEEGNAEERFSFLGASPEIKAAIDDLLSSDPAKVKAAEERVLADTTEAVVALGNVIKQGVRPELEQAANRLLTKLGPKAAPLIQFVVDNLKDPNAGVRAGSIQVLQSMGELGFKAAFAKLGSSEVDIRLGCAVVVGSFPKRADESMPVLLRLVTSDPSNGVRVEAARALAKLGKTGIEPLGRIAEAHSDPSMRILAIGALASSKDNTAFDALVAAINKSNEQNKEVKAQLVSALAQFPDYGPPQLIRLFNVEEVASTPAQKEIGREALVAIGEPAVDDLITAITHPIVQVRYYTAYTLQHMGATAESALPALEKAARTDPNGDVQMYARNAIAAIKAAL